LPRRKQAALRIHATEHTHLLKNCILVILAYPFRFVTACAPIAGPR
jgi:hypothetical protein